MQSAQARSLLAPLLAAATVACGPPPLAHTFPSAESLAEAVLDAVAQRDEATLRRLALNEQEFRAHVWPSLPAARPERNLPFSYVWGDLTQKSDASLAATLAGHGGRRYQLASLDFDAAPRLYAAFEVHSAPVFGLRDAGGGSHRLRLCGSFIEKDGAWKVFSYIRDD